MAVSFNHTIVYAADKKTSAEFFTEIFGLGPPQPMFGYFMTVTLEGGVALDYADVEGSLQPQHYAFLVTEDDFDGIFARIRSAGIDYWADPARSRPGQINHNDGGRGVYFTDPDGHFLEAITRPYGSGSG